jgi:hypothetical protein
MEKQKNIEKKLKEIEVESDEIAERLGPNLQKKIIDLSNTWDNYYGVSTLVGGLTSLITGYILFPEAPEEAGLPMRIVSACPGLIFGMFLGSGIGKKVEKMGYERLMRNYPDHKEDIQRMREIVATYTYLPTSSMPSM